MRITTLTSKTAPTKRCLLRRLSRGTRKSEELAVSGKRSSRALALFLTTNEGMRANIGRIRIRKWRVGAA